MGSRIRDRPDHWRHRDDRARSGSDLRGIQTTARKDGRGWVLKGAKTFITSGILCDLVIVFAKTDPSASSRGFSLFVVEDGTRGFAAVAS